MGRWPTADEDLRQKADEKKRLTGDPERLSKAIQAAREELDEQRRMEAERAAEEQRARRMRAETAEADARRSAIERAKAAEKLELARERRKNDAAAQAHTQRTTEAVRRIVAHTRCPFCGVPMETNHVCEK